jgi:hypothetical protein
MPLLLDSKQVTVQETNAELENKQKKVAEWESRLKTGVGNLLDDPTGAISSNSSKLRESDAILKIAKAELSDLIVKKEAAQEEVNEIRKKISGRYTNRILWTFLAGIFFMLSVSAIIISSTIIMGSMGNTVRWLAITSVVAISFALIAFFYPAYMEFILPMFKKTMLGSGDIDERWLIFFNVLGFGATVFLVAASASTLGSVREIDAQTEKLKKNSNEDLKPVIDRYSEQLKNIKAILYIGGLMLFVGVLQLKLLGEWHVLFLSNDPKDPSVSFLTDFFAQSAGVRAGYYVIMLAIIYLPVAYVIQDRADSLARTNVDVQPALQEEGLSFSFREFLPRLLTIISPFLAGPLFEFVGYLSKS